MLTFIVSLRAASLTRDWERHTWLVQRTLDSILAQTHRHFEAVIVCHETPQIPQIHHKAVKVLNVDFPPPRFDFDDMCADKVLKISRGVEWVLSRGHGHVMYVDADDLVSRRLSEFVAAHPAENGWYLDAGFALRYGQPWIRKHTGHHLVCGTAAIVHTRLLTWVRSDLYRRANVETLSAGGHTNYVAHLAARGTPLQKLPFAGAMYVIHPDSTSEAPGGSRDGLHTETVSGGPLRQGWVGTKKVARQVARVCPLTPSLRQDFSIPSRADIPVAYRSPALMV